MNAQLADENLRGYVVLLSAHFQGFCRNLYHEAMLIIVSKVRTSLQILIQNQFAVHCSLNHGNPNLDNITTDFSRFDFNARDELKQDPANTLRFQHLAELNRWRNIAAHQTVPIIPPPALTLASIQVWQNSCAGLAVSLDQITYNQLRRKLKRRPW